MAKQVLEWSTQQALKEGGEAKQFHDKSFQELNQLNTRLHQMLRYSPDYSSGDFREVCLQIRKILQHITAESKVPIEPEKQTTLLDDLFSSVPELLYASVPGAGGDDAIFALSKKDETKSLSSIIKERFIERHPNLAILPVGLTECNQDALVVRKSIK